jgi:hypothetical protein
MSGILHSMFFIGEDDIPPPPLPDPIILVPAMTMPAYLPDIGYYVNFVVDDGGTEVVRRSTSTDGITWNYDTSTNLPKIYSQFTPFNNLSVCEWGGAAYTEDFISINDSFFVFDIACFAASPSRIVGWEPNGSDRFAYSSDGMSWSYSNVSFPNIASPRNMIYSSTYSRWYVPGAAGDDNDGYLTSTNGTSWSRVALPLMPGGFGNVTD